MMNWNMKQCQRVLAGLLAFSLLIGAEMLLASSPEKDKITIALEEVEQILAAENAKIQATKPLKVKDLKKDEAVNSNISDQKAFKREILEINAVISEAKTTSNKTVAGFKLKKKEVSAVQLSGSGAQGDLQKTAAAKASQQKAFSEAGTSIKANATVLSAYAKKLLAIGAATNSTYKFGDQLTNLGKALSIMTTVLTDLGQFVMDSAKEGTEADKAFFSAVGSMNKATQRASETETLVGSSVDAYAAAHGTTGVLTGIAVAEKAMGGSGSSFDPDQNGMGGSGSSFDPDQNGMDGRGEAGGISGVGSGMSSAEAAAQEGAGMGNIGLDGAGAAAQEGLGMGDIGKDSDAGTAGSNAGTAGAEAEGAGMGDIGNDSDSDSDGDADGDAGAGDASDAGSCGPL
jgi:hypothetical protein